MIIETLYNLGDIFRLKIETKKKGGFTSETYPSGTKFQICNVNIEITKKNKQIVTYAFCHPYEEPFWLLEREQENVQEIMQKIGNSNILDFI